MVDTTLIIAIIVFVLIAIVLLKVAKSIMKAVFFLSLIMGLVMIITGIFVYLDAMDLKDNWSQSSKLLLLKSGDQIVSGFEGQITAIEKPVFLNQEKINSLNSFYEKKDYKSMLGNNYKLFIFDAEAFENLKEVRFEGEDGKVFSKDFIVSLFGQEDAMDKFIAEVAKKEGKEISDGGELKKELMKDYKSDVEFKGVLFAMLFMNALKEEGPLFILRQYKNENIIIYPKTAVFRVIKMLPVGLFDKVASTIKMKIGEKIKSTIE